MFAVALMTPAFGIDRPRSVRPIIAMIGLFSIAWAIYVYMSVTWMRIGSASRRAFWTMIGFGMLFRLILLPTTPIQEIDIYRYLWDGYATTQVGDPYRFAPLEFRQFDYSPQFRVDFHRSAEELEQLQNITSEIRSTATHDVLAEIHFSEYTSPYPPVSQAVFAAVAWVMPKSATAIHWLVAMKTVLLLFDAATVLLIAGCLRNANLGSHWVIALWWCPLPIKEFANSGHLDSIAIFFTAAFAYVCTRWFFGQRSVRATLPPGGSSLSEGRAEEPGLAPKRLSNPTFAGASAITAILLAMAIAAKIYPIVFIPVFAALMLKRSLWLAWIPALVLLAATTAMLWPMLQYLYPDKSETGHPQPGITAFTRSWEMNDLVFMIGVEHLKPMLVPTAKEQLPWFVGLVGTDAREANDATLTGPERQALNDLAFRATRLSLLAVWLTITLVCIANWWRNDTAQEFMKCCFYSVAWFWLLSPTQNPWYWCWALPFLPFVTNRLWFGFAGVVMFYYARFWFEYHFATEPVMNTSYTGTMFFDFVVPFIEFGPLLLLIFGWACWQRRRGTLSKR